MITLGRVTGEHACDAAVFCALAMTTSIVLAITANSFWPLLGYVPAWLVLLRVMLAMHNEINWRDDRFPRLGNLLIIPHPLNKPTPRRQDDLPLVPLRGKTHGS